MRGLLLQQRLQLHTIGERRLGGVPATKQLLALRACQHRQIPQTALGTLGHRQQQALEVLTQALHLTGRQAVGTVGVTDIQALVSTGHQGQGEMGALDRALAEYAQAVTAASKRTVHGEILEHQNAVEQRLARLPGPALDIVQRAVLELANVQVERLQISQPVANGPLRLDFMGNRQGIDEQTEQALCTR